MFLPALFLASVAPVILARPAFYAIQDIVGIQTDDKPVFAKTTVSVHNNWPLDVKPILLHYRGTDYDIKDIIEWDWLSPGNQTSDKEFKFDTVRRDWDSWQAGIRFPDPNWAFYTEQFEFSPAIEDIGRGLLFDLRADVVAGQLQRAKTEVEFFLDRGADFPKEAEAVNSFFFLHLQNDFDTKVSVTVELNTRSNTWWQDQTLIEDAGATSDQSVPFFFEKNSTKDYVELFNIKVNRKGKRPLIAKEKRCEMLADDAGADKELQVNSTGWSIGVPARVSCQGKW